MPLTEQQGRALAHLVHALRPDWDEPGILRKLQQVAGRNPFDVAMAALRAAADAGAKTPGVIPTEGPHWRERVSEQLVPRNPQPHEECGKHAGQFRLSCSGCRADKLAADHAARPEPLTREQALEQARADIAAARAARAATEPEIEIKETIA